MTTINVRLPEKLKTKAQRRAAESGHPNVEHYIKALVRADAEGDDLGAPERLTVTSADDLPPRPMATFRYELFVAMTWSAVR